jgi:hypothetical protein
VKIDDRVKYASKLSQSSSIVRSGNFQYLAALKDAGINIGQVSYTDSTGENEISSRDKYVWQCSVAGEFRCSVRRRFASPA